MAETLISIKIISIWVLLVPTFYMICSRMIKFFYQDGYLSRADVVFSVFFGLLWPICVPIYLLVAFLELLGYCFRKFVDWESTE